MPVASLITAWTMGVSQFNAKTLFNVSFIVIGVIIASFGEIKFVFIGFIWQVGGIAFEAIRLTMVQRLLSSSEFKMDPLVSLYYFAPVCAVMNGLVALFTEVPELSMQKLYDVGLITLTANAMVAFLLNVSVVFLVRIAISSSEMAYSNNLPDRQDFRPRPYSLRCPQGYPPRRCLHDDLGHSRYRPPVLRLRHRSLRSRLLQARR